MATILAHGTVGSRGLWRVPRSFLQAAPEFLLVPVQVVTLHRVGVEEGGVLSGGECQHQDPLSASGQVTAEQVIVGQVIVEQAEDDEEGGKIVVTF